MSLLDAGKPANRRERDIADSRPVAQASLVFLLLPGSLLYSPICSNELHRITGPTRSLSAVIGRHPASFILGIHNDDTLTPMILEPTAAECVS
ncbi:hypothetical protein DAEQUDRAFT_525135 [Daedalea quercina L-15889]|uniref:Uncharacterized protein n=1 Tax=Daedalea quercina L-15889 TaxID=1314783 RepID=A0A165MBX2_9APHY|nr:hypothetical protein DAEQUDRAFT_525135 [Daedalea quercina L-15889]